MSLTRLPRFVRSVTRTAALAAIPLCLAALAPAPTHAAELDGDWPGWIYFEKAGDMPLRLQLASDGGQLTAHIDAVVQKAFDLPVQKVAWDPPRLELERTSKAGTVIRFTGVVEGSAYRGQVQWGDESGEFECRRSALAISDTDLADAQDLVGHYRLPSGAPLVVTARAWGELVLRFWETGERRTLFPLADGTFFTGRALYAPDTVSARVRPVRAGDASTAGGAVTHLEWTPEGGEPQLAKRLELASEDVWFVADGDTLRGTVQRTTESGERPGVVLVGGSSWETRDDLRFRADMLTAMGFVTLCYDRRGHGLSGGAVTVPFDRSAKDAIAAAQFLRRRPEVAAAQVGLLGVSRGGWIAPLAASESDAIGFLMLLVTSAVSPVDQETQSRLDQLRRDGYGPDAINEVSALLGQGWRFMASGQGWEAYAESRRAAVEKGYPEYVFEHDSPDSALWAWGRMNMFYDPLPALTQVTCPVVALYGERDIYVATAINRTLLERALAAAGNADVTTVTLPGVGHGLAQESAAPIHLSHGVGDEGFSVLWRWARAHFKELP